MLAKRIRLGAVIVFTVLAVGTIGFLLIEDISFLDALFMTVITVSTVGYEEVVPLSNGGKVFAIFFILIGISAIGYAIGTLINATLQEFMHDVFRKRRMERKVSKLKEHYIIAGFGRVGRNVAIEFKMAKVRFVVVENDPAVVNELQQLGYEFIEGDATDDENLKKAGIDKAKGLVAAIHSDADNVFVCLSARDMNSDIFIVSRANTLQAVDKIKAAGANRVVSPSVIGGRTMAAWLLRPVVVDYLDLVTKGEKVEYRLEQLEVREEGPLDKRTIKEADIKGKTGAMILAIKTGDKINTNPGISTVINNKDQLIVVGTDEQLTALEEMV